MRIAVVGAGYVGLSNAVLLAQHHDVTVLDLDAHKIDQLARRTSPIEDPELEDYLANRELSLVSTTDPAVAYAGAEVVIVARSGQLRLLAYGLHLGARLPAHATSTGRVLLASLPPAEFEAWMAGEGSDRALPRLTPRTVVEPAAFRALIEQARRDDWCVASEEHELGIHALAVPVRNMQGKTVAALNVVAPPARLETAAIRRDLLPLLLDAARELRPLV